MNEKKYVVLPAFCDFSPENPMFLIDDAGFFVYNS